MAKRDSFRVALPQRHEFRCSDDIIKTVETKSVTARFMESDRENERQYSVLSRHSRASQVLPADIRRSARREKS